MVRWECPSFPRGLPSRSLPESLVISGLFFSSYIWCFLFQKLPKYLTDLFPDAARGFSSSGSAAHRLPHLPQVDGVARHHQVN